MNRVIVACCTSELPKRLLPQHVLRCCACACCMLVSMCMRSSCPSAVSTRHASMCNLATGETSFCGVVLEAAPLSLSYSLSSQHGSLIT